MDQPASHSLTEGWVPKALPTDVAAVYRNGRRPYLEALAVAEAVPISRSMKTNGKGEQALSFREAGTEIAQALAIPHRAAAMLLYGLAATGNVRTLDDELDPIDEDKCTISEIRGAASHMSVLRMFVAGSVSGLLFHNYRTERL